ncbi:aminotransferase class I/II-fold pyridoxal phosphate-dependent enzyme [Candidatus Woesearchaeota archaeon]|nr:aminotransferase class I/II-fold pyridoxal phosphate-dependent enzyme [Candidatus Woesearchaeota archaeon]
MVSQRVQDLKKSSILAFAQEVKRLQQEGADLVRLDMGDTNLPTPAGIVQATKTALDEGRTHYDGVSRGILPLRKALAAHYSERHNRKYSPENFLMTTGGVAALSVTFYALADIGDEIIITDPSWELYESQLLEMGITPVRIRLHEENKWKPQNEEISNALSDKTRAILLNSPSNPTGSMLSKTDLECIVSIASSHRTRPYVVSDEVYEEIVFEGQHTPLASVTDYSNIITIGSFSKSHAMTGWRAGYVIGPCEVVDQMEKKARTQWTCLPSFIQHGLVGFHAAEHTLAPNRDEYRERRGIVMQELEKIGLPCVVPAGGFYAFPDVSRISKDSERLCRHLLEHGVAVIPGACFGKYGEGHIRISFASSPKPAIIEGMHRLAHGLERYK